MEDVQQSENGELKEAQEEHEERKRTQDKKRDGCQNGEHVKENGKKRE
jgi:hypothetical protein